MKDVTEGLLIVFLGFALVKVGTYLIRLYERSMRLDPKRTMSWDIFAAFVGGPYAPAFIFGVVCIWGGVAVTIIGGLTFMFSLFPLFG